MRLLMLLSLTLPLGSPAAAHERIARVGQLMWSDRGAHHDATRRAFLDPVKTEFVKSLARPGARATGVTTMTAELTGKRMQMLVQAVPGLQRIGAPIDEVIRDTCKQEVDAMDEAARRLGVSLIYFQVKELEDVEPAIRKLADDRAQALLITFTSARHSLEQTIASAALKYRMAVMSQFRSDAPLGSLMSYGPDLDEVYRRAGQYAGRILKGEKPSKMPIQEPSKLHLAVNLKTARALGLTLPPGVMLADEVIE